MIHHPPSGRRALFDLAIRKDSQNLAPVVQQFLKLVEWEVEIKDDIVEVLDKQGIKPIDIEAVILSHHHFDHFGDLTKFPPETDLIVGPGFKTAHLPGFPTDQKSTLLESDWEGRQLREIAFEEAENISNIGGYEALDYFGDGSFYLLNSPGHTIGHISALARVTVDNNNNNDSFVLMGGDTCHDAGQIRPNAYLPLPDVVNPNPWPQQFPGSCSGAVVLSCLGRLSTEIHTPILKTPSAYVVDQAVAETSIKKLGCLDSAPNVFVIIAHDASLIGSIPTFPEKINDWKQSSLKEDSRWGFLASLNVKGSSEHKL